MSRISTAKLTAVAFMFLLLCLIGTTSTAGPPTASSGNIPDDVFAYGRANAIFSFKLPGNYDGRYVNFELKSLRLSKLEFRKGPARVNGQVVDFQPYAEEFIEELKSGAAKCVMKIDVVDLKLPLQGDHYLPAIAVGSYKGRNLEFGFKFRYIVHALKGFDVDLLNLTGDTPVDRAAGVGFERGSIWGIKTSLPKLAGLASPGGGALRPVGFRQTEFEIPPECEADPAACEEAAAAQAEAEISAESGTIAAIQEFRFHVKKLRGRVSD